MKHIYSILDVAPDGTCKQELYPTMKQAFRWQRMLSALNGDHKFFVIVEEV